MPGYDDTRSKSVRYPTDEQAQAKPGPLEGGYQMGPTTTFANPEIDRQLEHGNTAMAEYVTSMTVGDLPETDLPQPHPEVIGTPEYYDARQEDHLARHEGQPPPPDYYLEYGQKYCNRFSEDLFPKLSPAGQKWCIATRMNLQLGLERQLLADPELYALTELDNARFRRLAFDTHPQAYLESGLADLPIADLVQITLTPDLDDLLTTDGLAQIGVVAPEVLQNWALPHSSEEQE